MDIIFNELQVINNVIHIAANAKDDTEKSQMLGMKAKQSITVNGYPFTLSSSPIASRPESNRVLFPVYANEVSIYLNESLLNR